MGTSLGFLGPSSLHQPRLGVQPAPFGSPGDVWAAPCPLSVPNPTHAGRCWLCCCFTQATKATEMSSKPPGTFSILFSTSNNGGQTPASGDAVAASCPSSALHLPRAGLAKSQGGDEDIADARPGRGRAAAPALCAGSGVTQAAGSGVLQRGRKRAPRWEGCAPGLVRAGTGQSRAGTPAGTRACSR